jgi:hypothetical protein
VKQWLARYNGPGSGLDGAIDIAVDPIGATPNVYVTGRSTGKNANEDIATIKYNSAGARQWVARYNGLGNGHDGANRVLLDAAGNVYIAGYSFGSNNDHDFTTIKYSSAGLRQWIARYNAPADSSDIINDMVVDNNGNIYVTGSSIGVNGFEDVLTIKYSQGSPAVFLAQEHVAEVDKAPANETDVALPTQFDLAQNYPNPFNPSTTIRFDTPSSGRVKLAVYNLRGELMRTLMDGEIAAGYHTINFEMTGMASGIYFYKMEAGAFTATRKMILQK